MKTRNAAALVGPLQSIGGPLQSMMQIAAMGLVAAFAATALGATIGAALGWLPWLSIPVGYGAAEAGEPAQDAGMGVQVALTALLVALAFLVPSGLRVLRLETSHRRFAIGMEDIARAYHAAHADDRRSLFRMRSEFDAVRERLAHLREHPDLGGLEPDVLEIAAQMSVQSRRLAEVYADDKVARAQRFLAERQDEVERTRELIAKAHHAARELKRWSESVAVDESTVESQRQRLEAELAEILPQIGFEPGAERHQNVVRMPATAAE